MSTVIPYGTKIDVPLDEFFKFVQSLEAPMREVWDGEAVALASEQLIRAYTSDEDAAHSIVATAKMAWRETLKRMPDIADMFLKIEIVFGRSREGNILANPFGARPMIERFQSLEHVSAYSFDNRAAGPDDYGLSRTGYNRRAQEWEDLFDDYDSFASLLTWTLPRSEDIFAPIPLREDYRQAILDRIAPEQIARRRLAYLLRTEHQVGKNDHRRSIQITKWCDRVPVDDLGELPPMMTKKNFYSTERTSYEPPVSLLKTYVSTE